MAAKEAVRKSEIPVIPGLGLSPRARNPGTQTSASLGMAGVHRFRAWSYGPSRNDEEVSARQRHFVTASFAGATGKRRWELTCLVRTSSKQGLESRIVNLSTKTGGFAADLLQVQPLATIGSIHDCRLEHTNRTTWMMPGRAAANKRRCSASICRPASPWDAVGRCTMDHCLRPSLAWRTGDRTRGGRR